MVSVILIVIAALIAVWQWQAAWSRAREININYRASQAQLDVEKDPTIALRFVERAWQLNKNKITTSAIYKIYRENSFYKIIARLEKKIESVVFSRDGRYIIAGIEGGSRRAWHWQGGKFKEIKNLNQRDLLAGISAKDERYNLTGKVEGNVQLWDARGSKYQDFIGHEGRLCPGSYAISPDGKYVLTGAEDKTARLWDLQGQEIPPFRGHNKFITAVAFSPDGKYVLTGSFDQTARLWDLKGKELTVFKGHGGIIYTVAFSPDGQYVLTGSADKTVGVWDLKGNCVQVFRGHEGAVHSVTCKFNRGHKFSGTDISREDQYVLTGSSDGTVRLWKIYPLEEFLTNGTCELLSPGKLKEYGID
jgi:WD40 repeat protein